MSYGTKSVVPRTPVPDIFTIKSIIKNILVVIDDYKRNCRAG